MKADGQGHLNYDQCCLCSHSGRLMPPYGIWALLHHMLKAAKTIIKGLQLNVIQ